MSKILTENQKLLTRYLAAVGCETVAVLVMMVELHDEDAVLDVLEFCASHPDATQDELMKASSEISAKRARGPIMKVRYIGETDVSLTNGKEYDVISIEEGWYRIYDDTNCDYLFSPDEFEVIVAEIEML